MKFRACRFTGRDLKRASTGIQVRRHAPKLTRPVATKAEHKAKRPVMDNEKTRC
jgi:hypothetical protein